MKDSEDKPRDQTMGYLVKRLLGAQVSGATTEGGMRQNIELWMRTGKLNLRQRPHGNWWVVNENEVDKIIQEFSPGGSGYFHFNDMS